MKLYITRHGQVGNHAQYLDGNASLPRGEVPLSSVGREQATRLGKFLAKRNFHGIIYSSPFWRTMETAELIARETDSKILPAPWMHEILADYDWVKHYTGTELEQLRKWYPHIAPEATLTIPWWAEKTETSDDVLKRVSGGIKNLIEQYNDTDEEILLVGHGASTGAANRYLNLKLPGFLWNCCLGLYDTKAPENNFGKNYCFLPGQMVTNNKVYAKDYEFEDDDKKPWNIPIPSEAIESGEFKVLHIGDTHGATYPFYKQLIKLVKPDVIIHTGDTADEDKVGHDKTAHEAYIGKVFAFSKILRDADCPVYWVPGNNDLREIVAELAPFLKITEPDSVIDIQGKSLCLAHSRDQVTQKADFCLYGHGSNNDESFEDELCSMGKDSVCLNVMRGIYVLTLPEGKVMSIVRPD